MNSVALLVVSATLSERERLLISAAGGYGHDMAVQPDKLGALRATALALSDARVPFALIGGLAVGIRSGVPRATLDIDVAVPSSADLEGLTALLTSAGFSLVGRFAHSINFKHVSGEPLQLAFDPGFDAMIERAEPVEFDDFTLPVVTKADLISMKRRAASDPTRRVSKALRDRADVALLEGDVPDPDEGW